MLPYFGKWLISLSCFLLLLGLLLYFSPHLGKIPFLKSLGKLPGDISLQREGFHFYFPLSSSLLISILISLILFFIRFFKK